jgi:trk system potassium uptake protein TrkH
LGDIVRYQFKFKKLSVHSKIVLSMTAFLIIFGAVGILMSEHIDVLSALFQSVTARTAGFNTLDTGALSHGGLLLVILLMFVGASPGSTGGGIKTTTTFAIWLSLSSLMFGKQPAAFKRRIPDESLLRAFHVLLLALIAIVAGTLALAMLERDAFRFLDLAFEATSAFATVGLSTGITTQVRDGSKVVLMCLMFAGRLGPITMATLLRTKKPVLRYVEERVFIG